jgi:hypothetical protein
VTRACAWCGAEMGEKCNQCGGELVKHVTVGAVLWFCGNRAVAHGRRFFLKGDGGVTHTICDVCRHGLDNELAARRAMKGVPASSSSLLRQFCSIVGGFFSGSARWFLAWPCTKIRGNGVAAVPVADTTGRMQAAVVKHDKAAGRRAVFDFSF